MKRWVLLEHRLSKDNIQGRHYDLLFEEKSSCLTLQLSARPLLNQASVKAKLIQPHNLYWLDIKESAVSGGRGWAKQIESGFYSGLILNNDYFYVLLINFSNGYKAFLEFQEQACRIFSI
tara:strand:- start:30 stop:389 length:360 start_codon:yes stop_codon:yes gene_type:complete